MKFRAYYYLRDSIPFTKQYPEAVVKSGVVRFTKDNNRQIALIDDNQNCYTTCHDYKREEIINGEIGVYSLATGEYEPILSLADGSLARLHFVKGDFLVWTESLENSNWYKTRLHLYNTKTKEDEVIYQNAIDPETGLGYGWNFSTPVLLGQKLYFDDAVGKKNNQLLANLFCYDLSAKTTEVVAKNARWPLQYQDKVTWREDGKGEDETNIYCYDGKKKSLLIDIDGYSQDITGDGMGGELYLIIHGLDLNHDLQTAGTPLYLTDEENRNCSGLQVWKDGVTIPVVVSKKSYYIDYPLTNGQVVVFNNFYGVEKPIFYDAMAERIVKWI